jgi:hypothetical protein
MPGIPEADWKVFRKLREVALERFCERVLAEIEQVASNTGKSHHQRYLEIFKLIHHRDDELAGAFNNPARSTALWQLAAINSYGLLADEELSRFTPETQAFLQTLSPPGSPRGPEHT